MQKLGIDAPLVGHLPTANRLESGAVVDISNWGNPKLEPRSSRAPATMARSPPSVRRSS